MLSFIYLIITLVAVNINEAKLTDSRHKVGRVNPRDDTLLIFSVNNLPATGLYCAGATHWPLRKIRVDADFMNIVFYPREEEARRPSFPCHYVAQKTDPVFPIKLVDGYEEFIKWTNWYYDERIINETIVEPDTILVPTHDRGVYETFSVNFC